MGDGEAMKSRRAAWSDFAASRTLQPVLFDAAALAQVQPKRRRRGTVKKLEPKEVDLQRVILEALRLHPRVADIERINVLAGRLLGKDGKAGRFVRSCRKGNVDLQGMAIDGKKIAIEVKRPSTRMDVSDEQRAFLDAVRAAGGYAGVATSVEEAFAIVESSDV